MVDWKAHLGYQDATGVYAAKYDFDIDPSLVSTVRVLVFGEPFKSVWNPNWRKTLKFDEATGKCVSSGYSGRIVNVPQDMTAGLDPETGRPKLYTLEEAAAILGQGPGEAEMVTLVTTVRVKAGVVVSSDTARV